MQTQSSNNRIGIITEYYKSRNYGGLLQSFALQRFVDSRFKKCEQIAYDHKYTSIIKGLIKGIIHSKGKDRTRAISFAIRICLKYLLLPVTSIKIITRRKSIKRFALSIPHSAKTVEDKNLADILNDYDSFICGSDVVWHISNKPYATALGFVPEGKKKFSYAASIGSAFLPAGWSDKYLPYLNKLDAISVRERTVADELKKLLPDKQIQTVIDPTLLFTADEWYEYFKPRDCDNKYAFIYILSEDKNQMQAAVKYSKKCDVMSLTFPNIHSLISYWQRNYGDIQNYSANPLDFVRLIEKSEIVITDSFHAVIFSVLFHKPFFALKRESQKELIGRVENFLEDIGLMSQMITSNELASLNTIPKIDFNYADKVIEKKRKNSIDYLKENLK